MFVEELQGLASFPQPERSLHTSSLHWSECSEERGRRGCQAIHHPPTHKAHFMGIREAGGFFECICVFVCVRTCVVVDSCARKSQCASFFGASRRAQCVILCAVVCVGRYRRMQDGK